MSKKRFRLPNPFKKLSFAKNKGQKKRTGLKIGLAFKLYSSYALILLFLLVVGASSVFFMMQMSDNYTELYEERFQYVSEMLSLAHHFEQLNGAVAATLLKIINMKVLIILKSLDRKFNPK